MSDYGTRCVPAFDAVKGAGRKPSAGEVLKAVVIPRRCVEAASAAAEARVLVAVEAAAVVVVRRGWVEEVAAVAVALPG